MVGLGEEDESLTAIYQGNGSDVTILYNNDYNISNIDYMMIDDEKYSTPINEINFNDYKIHTVKYYLIDSYIQGHMFDGCTSLKKVNISSSITEIGEGAIWGCWNLSTITFLSETPPSVGYDVFNGLPQDGTIYVPSQYYGSTWGTWVTNNFPSGWQLRALE